MKNVVKVIGFMCLLFCVLAVVYRDLSWKDTSGEYISNTEMQKNTGKNKVDVVFAGSSHVYSGIYPAVLWKDYKIAAFDLSISEQDKNTTYYSLKQFLKKQSPKIVCVEMYGLMFDEHGKEGDLYRNMLSVNPSINDYKLIKESVPEGEEMNYFLRWPIVHTRYRELGKYDFVKRRINFCGNGAVVEDGIETGNVDTEVIKLTDSVELSAKNREWIDNLYALSKEGNFELIFFMTPYQQTAEERYIENGAKAYADSLGIKYIDFKELMGEIDFIPTEDMGDVWHCNTKGALKVTDYFGKYLSGNYILPDHTGEKGYDKWDEDYSHYRQMVQKRELKEKIGTEDIGEVIKNSCNLFVVFSAEGEMGSSYKVLEQFGITEDEYALGGKWIFTDGMLSKVMDNTPGESHIYSVNRYDSFVIQCDVNDNRLINVLFNSEGVNTLYDGMNILIYDKFEEEYLGNFGIPNER